MDGRAWLDDVIGRFEWLKRQCERAAAQVDDEAFFSPLSEHGNSLAVQLKHVGGNLRSRWRDVLTSDGEKPDRDREGEFTTAGQDRADVLALWEQGWAVALTALEALGPEDLERTVTIRGEPFSVVQAVHRSLAHTAYHAGQIVQLARHLAGDRWSMLSIAPGRSGAYNAEMARRHGDFGAAGGPR